MALVALAAPFAATAQEDEVEPPIPMPRIERPDDAAGGGTALEELAERLQALPGNDALSAVDAIDALAPQPDAVPQPVTLTARITEDGPLIPDGLVWRVFDTRADENGQMAMLARSEDATATLQLPPGDYLVHVAYGQSQATDTLSVGEYGTEKLMILETGGLILGAAVAGDIPIPSGQVRFDIYESGGERQAIETGVAPDTLVHLNAGVYNVVSRFGNVNATVRADIRVEPGQLTEAMLYHRAAQTSFRLVSEPGGEAIADVEWTVNTITGETVFTEHGAFPATVLAAGEYTVLARSGPDVHNRDFEVVSGQPREIEVVTID